MNFFNNLNRKYIIENNLPYGQIGRLKTKLHKEIGQCEKIISRPLHGFVEINNNNYQSFRSKIKKNFPEFILLINEMERTIDIEFLQIYLRKKEKQFRKNVSIENTVDKEIVTTVFENCINLKLPLPITKSIWKKINPALRRSLNKALSLGVKQLQKDSSSKIAHDNETTRKFEKDLHRIWKNPLNLLQLLIDSSIEVGQREKTKLANGKNRITNPRYVALIKIHARSVHIANEILSLLWSGYADGANARWRSLFELTGICLFLKQNNDNMSMRYLQHEAIKRFKNLNDYQKYGSKLGYKAVSQKEYSASKNNITNLLNKYTPEFKTDYGWIDKGVLADRNFKKLTEFVGIDGYYPFYNMSSDSVHGGPAGFLRLGLMHSRQDKVFLVGPSVYGLADPIQNTAYCLGILNESLLSLHSDYENIIRLGLLERFFQNIGKIAVKTQKELEAKSHKTSKKK